MAKYTDAKCRLCRREGGKLFLKGDKCYKPSCPFERRPVAPGQHGTERKYPNTDYNFVKNRRRREFTAYLKVSSETITRKPIE